MSHILSKLANDQVFAIYNKPEKGKSYEATTKILVRGMQSVHRKESRQSDNVAVTEVSEKTLEKLNLIDDYAYFVDAGFIVNVKSDDGKTLENAIAKLKGVDKSAPLTKKQILKDIDQSKANVDVDFNKVG